MDDKDAPPLSYFELDSPEGSFNAGYTPLPGDQGAQLGASPPSQLQDTYYPPVSYGTTDCQQLTLAPQVEQDYTSQAANCFQQSVMMAQPKSHTVMINSVPDRMTLAIFTTICCCWPLGLVAILRAQESRRALQKGDMLSASVFSEESRRFSLWAVGGGVFCLIVSIIIIVLIIRLNYNAYGY